jgi:hypothetical protein
MFKWPGMSGALDVTVVLEYGRSVIVDGCSARPTPRQLDDDGRAEAFFKRYRVFRCGV